MTPTIVPAYAAVLAIGYIYLAARVIRRRNRARIALGTGGDAALERAIRVQGNFADYVPLTLLLLGFAEMEGTRPWLLHALCVLLVAGRAVHAFGVAQENEDLRLRGIGMAATLAALGLAALLLLL